MLTNLIIKNFGLIDELELDFTSPLTIFTGETGAGKSIIIDALRYVLGERLNSSQIRNKKKDCIVEACFNISCETIKEYPPINELLAPDEQTLIINRLSSTDGKSKVKINGFNSTVSALKELGNHLVDFHGPHDHQMLLANETHIKILDRLSNIKTQKKEYTFLYAKYTSVKNKIRILEENASNRERDLDTLSFQINELEQVKLENEAYEQTIQDFKRLENTEKLFHDASALLELFETEDNGITDMLGQGFSLTKALAVTDNSTNNFSTLLTSIQEDSDNLIFELRNYIDSLSFEPEEAEEITTRCDAYNSILRKYGPAIEDACKFYNNAKEKYDTLIDFEHNDSALKTELSTIEKNLISNAEIISKARKQAAKNLQRTIETELQELGIKHVQFEVKFDKSALGADGFDDIIFFISPNAGEELKPLSEIVSSGEAARLMLALKKALTKVDPIPVLVFDEIDAQIGGRLGSITGSKVKEISSDRQILLITHLPQIAAFADTHYNVSKNVENNRTFVHVQKLTEKTQLEELAKMMGDDPNNKISISHAKEMLSQAQI